MGTRWLNLLVVVALAAACGDSDSSGDGDNARNSSANAMNAMNASNAANASNGSNTSNATNATNNVSNNDNNSTATNNANGSTNNGNATNNANNTNSSTNNTNNANSTNNAMCTDGETRCEGVTVETCDAGAFVEAQTCPFSCDQGACVDTVACAPNSYRCNGDAVEVCSATGTSFLHVATCTSGCSGGLCTGSCEPGANRCNADVVETCDAGGTSYAVSQTCAEGCWKGTCVLDSLDIALDTQLDGSVFVDGPVIIRSGATVTVPSGELELHADSFTVENGASLIVVPTTVGGEGIGGNSHECTSKWVVGGGGSYGTRGLNTSDTVRTGCASKVGFEYGNEIDAIVERGSQGGGYADQHPGGLGGGVLRVYGDAIDVTGEVSVEGESPNDTGNDAGGGSGGGVLFMAETVSVSGTVSTAGGQAWGTCCGYSPSPGHGGDGRVKILSLSPADLTGTVTGVLTTGLLPPREIYSTTHPDPATFYNDGADRVTFSWGRSFASTQGYYWDINARPTPAGGTYASTEFVEILPTELREGVNSFNVVSLDAMSAVGDIHQAFEVRLNTRPPAATSTSHPDSQTWSTNNAVFMTWTAPKGEENYRGYYYVVDQRGNTVPDKSATFLPASQLQVVLNNMSDGIWAFHIVSEDHQGYLTRAADHYVVRIGAEPEVGAVNGVVNDGGGNPVANARVSINGDLFGPITTNSTGNFNIQDVPVGTWEASFEKDGVEVTRMVTVTAGQGTNLTIDL